MVVLTRSVVSVSFPRSVNPLVSSTVCDAPLSSAPAGPVTIHFARSKKVSEWIAHLREFDVQRLILLPTG
jgi:hypothetical protein